jgi:hypothetical protein
MIPFVESLLNRILDARSEQRKAANKVSVRSLPRASDAAPREIEIDNSEGELPIYDCLLEQRRETDDSFTRVGWKGEVPARQTLTVTLENSAGSRRPRRLPEAQVTFRQNGWWWRKDSRGRLRRASEPADLAPRYKQ